MCDAFDDMKKDETVEKSMENVEKDISIQLISLGLRKIPLNSAKEDLGALTTLIL